MYYTLYNKPSTGVRGWILRIHPIFNQIFFEVHNPIINLKYQVKTQSTFIISNQKQA